MKPNDAFRKEKVALLSSLAFLVLPSLSVVAQTQTTGRFAGTVKDKNGAVIVGAEVTVFSKPTGDKRKVTTDSSGNYAVALLPPGIYQIAVTATGFKRTLVDDVEVIITQTTTVDAVLEVGDLKEPVSISLRMACEHAAERADKPVVVDPQAGDGKIARKNASLDAEDRYRIHHDAAI